MGLSLREKERREDATPCLATSMAAPYDLFRSLFDVGEDNVQLQKYAGDRLARLASIAR
jgi:hypothetical protein